MVDIRTLDEVEVNDEYIVVVAEDDGAYQAAVYAVRKELPGAMSTLTGSEGDIYSRVENAPRSVSDGKFTAIGNAIDDFEKHENYEEEPDGTGINIDE